MSTQKIGTYRKELMGIAMISIMIYHCTIRFSNAAVSDVYHHIRWFFAIGVDLFFLLSGFGLYYSFHRNHDLIQFYKKRLTRLFPTYVVFLVFWFCVSHLLGIETTGSFLYKYSLITFFTNGELSVWFIPAILLLYLIFPLIYSALHRFKHLLLVFCAGIYLTTFMIFVVLPGTTLQSITQVFLIRIPAFVLGAQLAHRQLNQIPSKTYSLRLCTGVFAALLLVLLVNCYLNTDYVRWVERILFLPCSALIVFICGEVLDRWAGRGSFAGFRHTLARIGDCTFQIYLLHNKIMDVYTDYSNGSKMASWLMNLAAMILSVVFAFALSSLVARLHRKKTPKAVS